MARSNRSSSTLLYAAAAAWGGVAVTSLVVRWNKRRRLAALETQIAEQGGLMPHVANVVQALEWRASSETANDTLALQAADGTSFTWKQYYDQVQRFAQALTRVAAAAASGEQQEHQFGVAVHAFNQPCWFFAAIGALAAGWTVSGIYLTNSYDQASHVIKTSEVKVLVLETKELLDTTYKTVLQDFPSLKVVLLEGGDADPNSRTPSYQAFVEDSGKGPALVTPPQDLPGTAVTTLVYTSGTTGNPKAVELTHDNITHVCTMMHARIPLPVGTKIVSYLPLSHIAAMGIDMFSTIFCGAEVYFADANALKGSLKDTLLKVRPTLFFGVPRVWEKMAAAMQQAAAKSYSKPGSGVILKSIGTAAKAVGGAWWSHTTPELVRCSLLAVPFGLFKALAFRKVRKGCGLNRCEFLYTGAAPLSAETMNYLRSLDMPLLEVFGMSESAGAIAVCGPADGARPVGACGRPLSLGQLSIAPDGEIVWKGSNNMIGYKGLPAATQAAINPSTGQLHTGDLGRLDDKTGFLYITGRKKDLIITAGGENVAPQSIEETFLSLLEGAAEHVVLIGDQRKFLTILIAPPETTTTADASNKSLEEAIVESAIATYNTNYAKSRAQRVQKAHVLESSFSIPTGELTPTMKVKRAFVVQKFASEIDAMYADGASKLVGYSSMNIGKIEEPTLA